MTKLLAHIRALQGRPNRENCNLIVRVTAGRKTHDILCADLIEAAQAYGELNSLGGKDLRTFSMRRNDSDGTVSVRELN